MDAKNQLIFNFEILGMDFKAAGQGATKIKQVLRQIGFNSSIIRRVAIITYEAELNIVIHATQGKVMALITSKSIEITAEDRGPGIPNIEQAMQEGFSTAPSHIQEMGFGAGMGLPNIKRNCDEFEISSEVGVGTRVRAVIYNPFVESVVNHAAILSFSKVK